MQQMLSTPTIIASKQSNDKCESIDQSLDATIKATDDIRSELPTIVSKSIKLQIDTSRSIDANDNSATR